LIHWLKRGVPQGAQVLGEVAENLEGKAGTFVVSATDAMMLWELLTAEERA
jgi:hypothetical protein